MFKIYDGRKEFYQWDLDRKLIVDDESINQVHFCNRSSDCSLVCEVRTEDNLRVVDVPNIILQSNWKVHAYGYDINYTKHEDMFNIVPRTKPENYVYTETEILNYNTLDERIDAVEETLANIPGMDLSAYSTTEEMNAAIDAAVAEIELMPGPVGPQGEPGKDGEDGYTPVKGVDYFDGEDGAPGKDGIDGQPGEDGYTPVRGTDYWTEADKTEIVNDVLAALPAAEEVSV